MSDIKRLALALVALGLSAPAFADSTVLVPSQHGGFKVGVDALYLRPTNSNLDYATTINFPANSTGFERNASVDPSYDWGVYAQIGYLFPCTGNDLTLSYTYLNNNNSDSVIAPAPSVSGSVASANGSILVQPLSSIIAGTSQADGTFGAAEGKSDFTLNVLDLDAGQRFTSGTYDMRMFAGLRYAKIDQTVKAVGHPFAIPAGITGVNSTVSGAQEFESEFRGIGPRIGVDSRYCLGCGFGFDADLSTSLLVGHTDSSYNAVITNADARDTLPTVTRFDAKNGSNTRLVPVLEAKLGVDYTYPIDCRCKSALVLEAGYQVTNYFNASDNRVRVLATEGSGFLADGDTNDVAFDGPYLGVKYYA